MTVTAAGIALIVVGSIFLLVAIALCIFACWYYSRKRKRREEKYGYFSRTPLDGPIRIANGGPHHTTNGYVHTISNGYVTGGHNPDRKRTTSASTPGYTATRTGRRRRDEVDARPAGHGTSSYHDSPHIRGPLYVYNPPGRAVGSRPPTFVVTRSGAYNERHGRSGNRNTHRAPRMSPLERYHHVGSEYPERERRVLDATTEGMSVDDVDGTALYLRWSPTTARRKREVREDFRRSGGGEWERPPSVGSFKIATNTLPLPRHKAALPSPIPVSHHKPWH